MAVYSLVLVLVTVAGTLWSSRLGGERTPDPGNTTDVPSDPGGTPLALGAQDTVVKSVTLPAGAPGSSLLFFDVQVEQTATSTTRAAMVSFRVNCSDADGNIEMQSTGKLSTNMFLAQGGAVSGQALTSETDQELRCDLLASAPFAEPTEDEESSLTLRADLHTVPTTGAHLLALPRLDDATLIEPGTNETVLSLRVEDPPALDRMSTTVRLTSCTVVGGSRDAGENKCQESMTGRESSTVRVRVIARWLDGKGAVAGTTTYWDETLAVDYNTHHFPWTLRQAGMADRVPESAEAVVMVVQVESLAGTPVVIHADGTDAVITTHA